jgi:hypothetical protein
MYRDESGPEEANCRLRLNAVIEDLVQYVTRMPRALVTNLAMEYLPLVSRKVDVDVLMITLFARCGLTTITLEKFPFWLTYFETRYRGRTGGQYLDSCSEVLHSTLSRPDTYAHMTHLNLSRLDAIQYPASHDELFAAIAAGGVHLKHLDLSDGGPLVDDYHIEHFWKPPGHQSLEYFGGHPSYQDHFSRRPGNTRGVPCPELEHFSVLGCNKVSAVAVAQVLLCHPKLTYLGFRSLGPVLEVVEERVLKQGKEFKCLLTHVNWYVKS